MPSGSIVFVDTNVLLYAQDPRAHDKRLAAQAWLSRCWREASGRVSTQVLDELYVNLRRVAPKLDRHVGRRLVRNYWTWSPWVIDEETVTLAWELQDRFEFSFWDSLIAASAQMQGCHVLLTEDLQHDQRIDELRIVNPFVVGPELLDARA